MSRPKLLGIGIVVVILLPIAAFFAIPVLLGFESVGPPELVVGDRASAAITAVINRGEEAETVVTPQPAEIATDVEVESIEGRWVIAGDSVAGYRVFKDFVGASQFEAVGRTSSIFGELAISGNSVTEATFSVDIASITSDDDRRDQQFRGPILNAALFPFANFQLLSDIDLGAVPTSGAEIRVDVLGTLTLKGTTQEVEFALTARIVGDEVQVAGSIDVVFADYDITPPTTPTIEVHDEGVIEFSLFFEQPEEA